MNVECVGNEVIFSGVCPDKLHVKDYLNDSIDTIRFKDFDTSEVVDMSHMFEGCSNWVSISGLESFNTVNVKNMRCMFKSCNPRGLVPYASPMTLTGVNLLRGLNAFDTSSVEDMSYMFCGCDVFVCDELDAWNLQNLKNADGMFSSLYYITDIHLPNWSTPKLISCSKMFARCASLHSIIMTNFGCSKYLKDVSSMLNDSEEISSIVMPKLHITEHTNVNEFVEMYHGIREESNFDIDPRDRISICAMLHYYYTKYLLSKCPAPRTNRR